MQADALSQTFAALADPTRRAILKRLAAGSANVKELSRPFDMSGPAVCKHLRVLERAGLVGKERIGRRKVVRTQQSGLLTAQRLLDDYEELWRGRIARMTDILKEPKEAHS